MISNITLKVKASFLSLSILVLLLVSCSSDDEPTVNLTTGTHKIVLKMEGNSNLSYTFAFAGATTSGTASRLYDKENEYQGNAYTKTGILTGNSTEIICSTTDNGALLALSLSISSPEATGKVTYSLKAYINDKEVDELQKTVTFTENNLTEMVNFSTTSN